MKADILNNQNKIGYLKICVSIGVILFIASVYLSSPTLILFVGGFVSALFFCLFSLLWLSGRKFQKYLGGFNLLVGFLVFESVAKGAYESIQIVAIAILVYCPLIEGLMRYLRYSNMKESYPSYVDQTLIRALIMPDYNRGFDTNSEAKEVINNVLRVRKGNSKAADAFLEILSKVESYKNIENMKFGEFKEFILNTNLGLNKMKIKILFG